MQLRRVNKKIRNHIEKIEEEDEIVGRFLNELIKKESKKGKNWHYKSDYRKWIKNATEEWIKNVED